MISVAAALPGSLSASDLDELREAATRGEPEALFQLASMYEQADTVEHDIEQAARYMRLAAERGQREAQYRLGLLYAAGLGLPKDPEQSYMWLTLASAGEGRTALLAAAMRDAVATRLTPDALMRAKNLAARFQPTKDLPDLPEERGAGARLAGAAPASDQLAELKTLLPATDCGEPVLTRDDGGHLIAAGYSPAGASASPADGRLAELLRHRGVTLDLTPLEPKLCAVLALLAAPPAKAGPPPEVLLSDPGGPPKQLFKNGEYLVVKLLAEAQAGYATIDYFVHDGSVVHMTPSSAYPDNKLAAGEPLVLGEPGAHHQTWQISPPFGHDLLVAFVSERPLYQGQRAAVEPIEAYLDVLRRRLASTLPNDTVRMGYRVVQTTSG